MTDGELTEKQAIEKATAERFLAVYNEQYHSAYRIIELGDAPDVRCLDEQTGVLLGLEICVLEDLPGDAQHRLGRGPKPPGGLRTGARSFRDDTVEQLIARLKKKLRMRYGPSTALVVRQLSSIWDRRDWEWHAEVLWTGISYSADTFDRGIWVLCAKTEGSSSPDSMLRIGSDDILRIDPSISTAGP